MWMDKTSGWPTVTCEYAPWTDSAISSLEFSMAPTASTTWPPNAVLVDNDFAAVYDAANSKVTKKFIVKWEDGAGAVAVSSLINCNGGVTGRAEVTYEPLPVSMIPKPVITG